MKTATETPTNGSTIVETTTRRRIVPESSTVTPLTRTTPDYWEYLVTLDKNPDEWEHHVVYVYRYEPKPSTPVDKCTQFMVMPDGQRVLMSDREEMEFAVAKRWGGRDFRFIVKRHSERITETHILVDAPPRPITPLEPSNGNGATVTPYTSGTMSEAGSTAYVAGQAMHALTNQERQSAEIGFRAMETAANVMQRFGKTEPAPAPQDDITRQFMQAMVARMMAPPPDPLDTLTKLLAIMHQVGGGAATGGAAGAAAPIVDRILTTALDRFVNPAPSGPVVSAGAELVRTLPQVAITAVDGMREWRAGMEAQRDTVLAARSPVPAGTPLPQPSVLPPSAPNPRPNGAAAVNQPSPEFVQSKMVEILKEPVSAEQAADDALAFLSVIDQKLVEYLAGLGETGLVNLFQTSPTLKPATVNMPRLLDFIRAFLKLHNEDKEADANERKSN